MRKTVRCLLVLTLLIGLALLSSACKKEVAPIAPPPPDPTPVAPPPPPAPTINLSASPTAVERGESSTLSWSTTNAASVTIDGGVGTVSASGSRRVAPTQSTTYTARAEGRGGNASASARITVTEAPPPPPPPVEISDLDFVTTNVKDIYFDYDKHDIRSDARSALQSNARAMRERNHIRFSVEGHCDERGSERYNLALGDRRANAAKDFLVAQGISASRLETVSYGEERPKNPGHDEAAWSENRRAHFKMR